MAKLARGINYPHMYRLKASDAGTCSIFTPTTRQSKFNVKVAEEAVWTFVEDITTDEDVSNKTNAEALFADTDNDVVAFRTLATTEELDIRVPNGFVLAIRSFAGQSDTTAQNKGIRIYEYIEVKGT